MNYAVYTLVDDYTWELTIVLESPEDVKDFCQLFPEQTMNIVIADNNASDFHSDISTDTMYFVVHINRAFPFCQNDPDRFF